MFFFFQCPKELKLNNLLCKSSPSQTMVDVYLNCSWATRYIGNWNIRSWQKIRSLLFDSRLLIVASLFLQIGIIPQKLIGTLNCKQTFRLLMKLFSATDKLSSQPLGDEWICTIIIIEIGTDTSGGLWSKFLWIDQEHELMFHHLCESWTPWMTIFTFLWFWVSM